MIAGTIIKGVGGQYTVDTPERQYTCNARGLFRKLKVTPIVGDRVMINLAEDGVTGTLMEIMPRDNALRRPRVANVDQVAIVVAAAQPKPHFAMLDRYLIQAEYEGIEASICINKTDLDGHVPEEVRKIYEPAGYPVFAVSTTGGEGIDTFGEFLTGKTTVLAGPSGVGKSSIINCLKKGAVQTIATGAVSERIGRGKHTTRHTEFFPLAFGGYAIDTPGFSSLEPPDIPKPERAVLFKEFRPFLGQCKYRDCMHWSEQDCEVKAQVGAAIDPRRYAEYLEWIRS